MAVYARAMQSIFHDRPASLAETLLLGVALDLRPGAGAPSYEAIAAQTGLSVGNVKVRVFRIRESFKRAFRDECARLGGSADLAKVEMESLFNVLLGALRQGL